MLLFLCTAASSPLLFSMNILGHFLYWFSMTILIYRRQSCTFPSLQKKFVPRSCYHQSSATNHWFCRTFCLFLLGAKNFSEGIGMAPQTTMSLIFFSYVRLGKNPQFNSFFRRSQSVFFPATITLEFRPYARRLQAPRSLTLGASHIFSKSKGGHRPGYLSMEASWTWLASSLNHFLFFSFSLWKVNVCIYDFLFFVASPRSAVSVQRGTEGSS